MKVGDIIGRTLGHDQMVESGARAWAKCIGLMTSAWTAVRPEGAAARFADHGDSAAALPSRVPGAVRPESPEHCHHLYFRLQDDIVVTAHCVMYRTVVRDVTVYH